MDILGQVKMADFLLKLYRGELDKISAYPHVPQKPPFSPGSKPSVPLPRATPESQGVSAWYLESFFQELAGLEGSNPHSVLILRHGKVIAEGHFRPYNPQCPHMLYSLSKTVTATAVGMAVREGLLSLDDRLVDIFADKMTPIHNPRLNQITLRHLLTMQSGIKFNELGSVLTKDWAKGFMQSEIVQEPGRVFSYNSMNSYMLAAAVVRKSGQSLTEFLRPRLYEPLGIGCYHWETCPLGIEKGGWGLSLRPEDIAKLGLLYLQGGEWLVQGAWRQILPRSWVDDAVKNQAAGEGAPHEGYGYHIWMCGDKGGYDFNGIFGQYAIVLPRQDMVVAVTAGSQNLFPEGSILHLVQRYFDGEQLSASALRRDKRADRALARTTASLRHLSGVFAPRSGSGTEKRWVLRLPVGKKEKPRLTRRESRYQGKTYDLEKSFGSLLPFVLQAVHGNFTGGMRRVRFRFLPGRCLLEVTEGGRLHRVMAGTGGKPAYCRLNIGGEDYLVGAVAQWATDEDGHDVLKVLLDFLETPDTRIIKFIFLNRSAAGGSDLLVRFDELPSVKDALSLLGGVVSLQGGAGNAVRVRLKRLISPKAAGHAGHLIKQEKAEPENKPGE